MSEQSTAVDDPGPALLALYDAELPIVYGYLLSRCDLATLAEDLTAEVFLAAVDAVRRDREVTLSTEFAYWRGPPQAGRPLASAGTRRPAPRRRGRR